MRELIQSFPQQLKASLKSNKIEGPAISNSAISAVIVCGMGGSGIGGELLKPLAKNVDILTHHDYGLPKNVDKKSLVVIVSFSGNTEEAVSSYDEAKKRKAKVIVLTSGGKLADKDNIDPASQRLIHEQHVLHYQYKRLLKEY